MAPSAPYVTTLAFLPLALERFSSGGTTRACEVILAKDLLAFYWWSRAVNLPLLRSNVANTASPFC
jgi:hypothetical protein